MGNKVASRGTFSEQKCYSTQNTIMTHNGESAYISTGNITNERKTENQNIQIGNRSATLYLSSHSIKVHDDLKRLSSREPTRASAAGKPQETSTNTTPARSRANTQTKDDSNEFSKEISKLKPIREFTFTGYDIMSDVEPEPTIPEEEIEPRKRLKTYLDSCKHFGTTPVTFISKQMSNRELIMRNHSIGPKGARALALALLDNDTVKSLDLEDDGLGAEGAEAIAEMLQQNKNILDVNISENLIGTNGARAIANLMKSNQRIRSLDISGSSLVDNDAKFIAEILENNTTLRELILSHNAFGEKGGYIIAQALAQNDTLNILDISWNHLRGKGSMSVAACLQKNIGLRKLDVSWNGFSKNDAYALGKTLKDNTTLKELDISHNRLDKEGIGHLLQGLNESDGLEIIRLGGNFITPELALIILKYIGESETCRIHQIDLSEVEVDEDFLTLLDDIQASKSLTVHHGPVIKRENAANRSGKGIDGNLDAVHELYKYMHANNYRVIDLMKWLDKDGDMSVSRAEFKKGMITAEVPLTEHQLDELLDKLDLDGDGEVDFSELLVGERDFRRRLRRKQEREQAARNMKQDSNRIILASINENT